MKNIVILGAGLAGLSSALIFSKRNDCRVAIIEKNDRVGGLARSIEWGRSIVDIGSHAFRTEFTDVLKEVKRLCGDELLITNRKSRIWMDGDYITYPPTLADLLCRIGPSLGISYLSSYLKARVKSIFLKNTADTTFQDWTERHFGRVIAKKFFDDYAEKTWGIPASMLDIELARRKIAISNPWKLLTKLVFGHSRSDFSYSQFYYPNKGIGMIAEAMAKEIKDNGGIFHLKSVVHRIERDDDHIRSVQYKNPDGVTNTIEADFVISTIPVTELMAYLYPQIDAPLLALAHSLRFRALILLYIKLKEAVSNNATWLYFPEKEISFNRIYSQRKYSPATVRDAADLLSIEMTCQETDTMWNLPDSGIFEDVVSQLEKVRLVDRDDIKEYLVLRERYAYPVYEVGYKKRLDKILGYLATFKNLISNGRQGLFNYNNMDHSFKMGMVSADHLLNGWDGKCWLAQTRQFDAYRIVD